MKPIKIPDGPLPDGKYLWGYYYEIEHGEGTVIIVTSGISFFLSPSGIKDKVQNSKWNLGKKTRLYKLSIKSYYESI